MNLNDSLDFRATYQNFVKTLLLVMSVFLITFIKIYIDQRNDINLLNKKLSNKDILLIPASSSVLTGKLNQVSTEDIKTEAKYLITMLTNISPNTVVSNFKEVSNKMNARVKVKFLNSSFKKIESLKSNNITESLEHFSLEAVQTGRYTYKVTTSINIDIVIGNLKSGSRKEIIEFDLSVIEPSLKKRWFFEITTFKRLSPRDYEKLKGVK